MPTALQARLGRGPEGFTELYLTGVSLRELSYLFRSRFRAGYAILTELDTGSVLDTDVFDALEAEGHLCDVLDEEGEVRLVRVDAIDVLADMKPFRLGLVFVAGPVTAEDFRLAEGSRALYPDAPGALARLGCRAALFWRADSQLMLASREAWFPRDVLEYFFEKSFLDNERMLRPDELERLMATFMPPLADTGLTVRVDGPVSDEGPILAIGWSDPPEGGSPDVEAARFRVERSPTGVEAVLDGKVRVREYLGAAWYVDARLRGLRALVGPGLVTAAVVFLLLAALPAGNEPPPALLEILFLVVLLNLVNAMRR